jgi:hypothetical protein
MEESSILVLPPVYKENSLKECMDLDHEEIHFLWLIAELYYLEESSLLYLNNETLGDEDE